MIFESGFMIAGGWSEARIRAGRRFRCGSRAAEADRAIAGGMGRPCRAVARDALKDWMAGDETRLSGNSSDRSQRALQPVSRVGVGAQEAAVAGVPVVDQQGRVEVRQPLAEQVVGDRGIFFDVVEDQVAVGGAQVAAALRAAARRAEQKTSIWSEKSSRLCSRQYWRKRLAQVWASS